MAYSTEELLELGFKAEGDIINTTAFSADGLFDSFSGYGAFTPITISTKTKLRNADLERSKSRD
ncbi:MAG: hypothetical protein AAFP85_15475 [Pseudomonadota bacterium]